MAIQPFILLDPDLEHVGVNVEIKEPPPEDDVLEK